MFLGCKHEKNSNVKLNPTESHRFTLSSSPRLNACLWVSVFVRENKWWGGEKMKWRGGGGGKRRVEVLLSQWDKMEDRVSLHMPTYLMCWLGVSWYCGCFSVCKGGGQEKHHTLEKYWTTRTSASWVNASETCCSLHPFLSRFIIYDVKILRNLLENVAAKLCNN